jgi:mannonate dehydratase
MGFADETAEVFHSEVRFADGMLLPSEEPGLGVSYDDAAAEKFPYEPKYLPIARRLDGSVHDW